jgi:hypothetical protein
LIDRARSHKTRACGKLKAEKRENFWNVIESEK